MGISNIIGIVRYILKVTSAIAEQEAVAFLLKKEIS